MRSALIARNLLSGATADRIIEETRQEMQEAIRSAEAAPYPDPSELLTDVYS